MAFTGQDGVLVWQKVAKALLGANPAHAAAFRELKTYITTQGGNPQLQFVPYTAAQATTNGGTSLVGGPATLYGWYEKNARTTGTTSAFEALHNAADNNSAAAEAILQNATGQSFAVIHPTGQAFSTDITVSSATTIGGATESSAANAGNGFIVVGA